MNFGTATVTVTTTSMEKPHKAHHKPSAGSKLDKKDKAQGVDRRHAHGYNPKVRATVC